MNDRRDYDDDWTRYTSELRKRRNVLAIEVLSGRCSPENYQHMCGQVLQIDEAIKLITTIRRGEEVNQGARPEPLRSPEE